MPPNQNLEPDSYRAIQHDRILIIDCQQISGANGLWQEPEKMLPLVLAALGIDRIDLRVRGQGHFPPFSLDHLISRIAE